MAPLCELIPGYASHTTPLPWQTNNIFIISIIRLPAKGINDWRITAARKLIPSKADSVLPDVQSLSVL